MCYTYFSIGGILNIIHDKIVQFSNNIDIDYWINLIELVNIDSYPFEEVNRRPHLTMKLPMLFSHNDSIAAVKLRAEFLSLVMKPISEYMSLYGIEHMVPKKDFITVSKMKPFTSMYPHKDDKNYDSDNFICMLYINDDFDGGELEFTDLNITYTPKSGDIIIYQSKMRHGVTQLYGSDRYNIGYGFKGPVAPLEGFEPPTKRVETVDSSTEL